MSCLPTIQEPPLGVCPKVPQPTQGDHDPSES